MNSSAIRTQLPWLCLGLACGLAAGAGLLFAVLNRPILGFTLVAAILGVAAGVFSGNWRLFVLWGLALTIPLELNFNFRVMPHAGGAGGFSIEISDPFLLALLYFSIRDLLQGRIAGYRIHASVFYWGGMIALGLVAVIMGPWRTSASHEVVRMVKVIVLFVVVANELVSRDRMKQVALALLVGVVLQSLIALAQYGTNARFGLGVLGEADEISTESLEIGTLTQGARVYRVGGLMSHPNVLAAYIAMLLPIAVGFLFTRIPPGQKLFAIATLCLGEAALILTLSRSGWITFGMAMTLVLIVSYRNKFMRGRYMVLRVTFLLLMALVATAMSGPILQRLFQSDPGAVEARLHLAEVAWRMIQDRPILGCGLNAYTFESVPYTGLGGFVAALEFYGGRMPAVHNIYLLIWAEQGLVGLILFLLVHFAILRTGWRNLRVQDDVLFAINLGCCCGILALMLDGMASFTIRFSGPLRVFWTMCALIVAIRYWHLRKSAQGPEPEEVFVIHEP